MQTIHVGFIGAGKSTHRYQAPFILRRPEKFTITEIFARHLDHIKWEKIPGVTYTDDLEAVLADENIDLIVVSTPVMHYEYTKMALEHGKNVVCEKPFTDTYKQAKELFDLAKEKQLLCMAIQNRRFDSDFLTTQKVIESGLLGNILEVNMCYDYYRPDVPLNANHFDPYHGYLYGHACHTLDQALSYFGMPKNHHFEVRQLLGKGRMNDYFDLDLFYDKGLKVSVQSSYFRVKARPRFTVYGTKGTFIKQSEDRQEFDLKRFYMPTPDHPDFGVDLPSDYGTVYYYDDHGDYHEEVIKSVNGDYARYYDAVYDSLVNEAPLLVKPEETLTQLAFLEEGIKQCF